MAVETETARTVVAYRWADYDTPLWASPNRVAGRWHALGAGPTQYWSLHPLGAWAEYVRSQGIYDPAGLETVSSRTWAAEFDLGGATVTTVSFANAGDYGVTPAQLVADDHGPCRRLGGALRADHDALIVPSAALPGTDNLVIFGPRVMVPYGIEPPDPSVDVPTAPTADRARPPVELLGLVCHLGGRHAGLDEWRATGRTLPPPDVMHAGRP